VIGKGKGKFKRKDGALYREDDFKEDLHLHRGKGGAGELWGRGGKVKKKRGTRRFKSSGSATSEAGRENAKHHSVT